MTLSGARRNWWALAVLIVVLESVVAQRAAAQWRTEVFPGVRFGPPMRASLALGVVYGNRTRFAQFAGPIGLMEAGVGGARVSAGYLMAFPFATGVEVLGSAIRTWGRPAQAAAGRTLVGGEVRVLVFAVNAGLGVYRPTRGIGDDRRTRYYLNLGLGL
jgi:hypothetical protein